MALDLVLRTSARISALLFVGLIGAAHQFETTARMVKASSGPLGNKTPTLSPLLSPNAPRSNSFWINCRNLLCVSGARSPTTASERHAVSVSGNKSTKFEYRPCSNFSTSTPRTKRFRPFSP